jgi:predicted  nucleic acid-binding Zn-ribbon protein
VLSAVLWIKWSDNRREAARLQRELTRVYKEAEDLRMQATLGQERIARLERELRALKAESQARPMEDKKGGRSAPKR